MPPSLSYDHLQAMLRQHPAHLPDLRKPSPNTSYTIQDAALAAFGLFFTQSPSFLEYQRRLQHSKGHNNAQTLFGVGQIPCDNQVRALLDRVAPRHCTPVLLEVFDQLHQAHLLAPWRVLDHQLLVALEGTQYFSSQAIRCPNCLTRQLANGQTRYYHPAITPVVVSPGHAQVLALPPEYIMPQDGHDKQDCAQAAGKRWLRQYGAALAPYHVTFLGEDLSSKQPFCSLALAQGCNFILVCKPDSHAKLSQRLAFWQVQDAMVEWEQRRKNGRLTDVAQYRFVNEVLLQEGPQALSVNWVEIPVINAKTGEQRSDNTFITNHHVNVEAVAHVAQAGRGRWKVENAHHNVLKTKGDHLEHTFGHGKQYLSATMLSLNLLAFLFHTVLEWSDQKDTLLRQVLARRPTFFDDMQALTRYMVFPSWQHLMDVMIRGLALEAQLEPDLGPPLDTS
jgi:hypothetical protein